MMSLEEEKWGRNKVTVNNCPPSTRPQKIVLDALAKMTKFNGAFKPVL